MSSLPDRLEIQAACLQAMLAHLTACLPEEACGLLGGRVGQGAFTVTLVLPVENALHSPVRFRMAPAEQLKAFYALEACGLELLAIFHSHPSGPAHLSATDLAEFAYPGVLMVIASPLAAPGNSALPSALWQLRAFHVAEALSAGSAVSEIPIKILPDSTQNPLPGL